MAVYSNYYCPNCKQKIESLVLKGSKGLSVPFQRCSRCSTIVLLTDTYIEWDLMTEKEQRAMQRRTWYSAIQMGGLLSGFGAFIGLGSLCPGFLNQGTPIIVGTCLVFFLIGATVHHFYLRRWFDKEIEKSKKRMEDGQYRTELQQLGLLRPAKS